MAESRKAVCIVGACAFVYFVFFPGDIAALGEPVNELVRAVGQPLNTLLQLSTSVSPWLYGLVIAVVLGRTVTGVWGKAPKPATKRKASPKAN